MSVNDQERLGIAAYSGCFTQYGHPHTRDLFTAWQMLGEDQRRMWRDVGKSVAETIRQHGG